MLPFDKTILAEKMLMLTRIDPSVRFFSLFSPSTATMTKIPLRTGLLLALPCLVLTARASVLVNLDATSLPLGPLPAWSDTGTVAGDFVASGAPAVTSVAGVKAVTLSGGA